MGLNGSSQRFVSGVVAANCEPEQQLDAAIALANVLSRGLGTNISAEQVRELITKKWNALSVLSHAVHDEVRKGERR